MMAVNREDFQKAIGPPLKRLACLLFLLLPALGQAQEWRIYTHSLGNQGVLIDGQLHGREHAML